MSVESSLFSLANAERYVFRPVFVFVTFLLILLAAVQATGRLTMQVLHVFEPEVQALAGSFGVSVYGLDGDWRGFNPVLRVARLEFGAGHATELEVELDMLESIFRNDLVLRRGVAEQVSVALEQTGQGWRLRGMPPGERSFDVATLLENSDLLKASATVELHGPELSLVHAEARLMNYGGAHYAELTVAGDGQPVAPLLARYWQQDALPAVRARAFALTAQGGLYVPAALGQLAGTTINLDEVLWFENETRGGGTFSVTVDNLAVPGVPQTLTARLAMQGQRRDDAVLAMSTELTVHAGDETLALGPLYLRGAVPEEESALAAAAEILETPTPRPLMQVWLAQLDLAEVSGFFDRHLGNWEPAGRWVRELALQGSVSNVHAYLDPDLGAGYMASFTDLQMQGYKGAPTLIGAQGQLWGGGRAIAAQVNASNVDIQFPDLFTTLWHMDDVQGVVKGWVGPGYFALRGSHLRARMSDTGIAGEFAITRPDPRYEQRVSLTLNVDQVDMDTARTFVPFKIPLQLAEWLDYGPLAGRLSDARFAYHGQVHTRPEELGRRIELAAVISNGRVRYEPTWPIVGDIEGRVHVAGVNTRISVAGAQSRAVPFKNSSVVLHNNGDYVSARLDSDTQMAALLDFVRNSPLHEDLSFVDPSWRGQGPLSLTGELVVPLKADRSPPLQADLDFRPRGVELDMPNYRTRVRDLKGTGSFSLPHHLAGEFTGTLFDRPANIRVEHDPDWLRFAIQGTATPVHAYALIEFDGAVPVEGEFSFDSVLSLVMGDADGVSNLALTSDLQGLAINLPGRFRKSPAEPSPSELDLQFLPDYQSVRFRHNDVQGWLHYGDEIERGALGVGTAPPMTVEDDKAVLISGTMPRVVLSDWVSGDGESAVSLPLDWRIQSLRVDEFVIDELVFDSLRLNGQQNGEDVAFEFDGPTLKGSIAIPASDRMDINLEYLQLPTSDDSFSEHPGAPRQDPLTVEVAKSLPAARVNIGQLVLGDEPFGSWRFNIQPQAQLVSFIDFGADVNGVHIESASLSWDLVRNVSSFSGNISLDDLAETLPKWDYAASVSTESASVSADVAWPGSPVNISLLDTTGGVDFVARDGRFIEVASVGGARILGLMNFSKIASRINFDFSDVMGEGISFEKIEAKVGLNRGELNFPERMIVDSSSGNFQVGGKVNLHSGELDNEMIVTLPVSKSLPWYGVYLALANPLAGLGVIVGERVLRKPIEQFSTAKYAVRGTLDDPEVSFVSLWDTSMKEATDGGSREEQPAASVDNGNAELAGEPALVDPSR